MIQSSSIRVLGLCILTGCSATSTVERPHLPFHVAIVPVQPVAMPVTGAAAKERSALALDLDPVHVRDDLAAELRQRCFTRVSMLQLPQGVTADEFQRWPDAQREHYWSESARAAGADLILHSELRAARGMKCETNSRCWFNIPLFLLGGPGCYFVDDCSYVGDARLDAWLSNVSDAAERGVGAALVSVQSRFDRADLDFLDRAGSRPFPYVVSLFVPATWLTRSGEHVEKRVASKAAGLLASGVAQAIRTESRRILVAQSVSSFYVDPASRLERAGETLHFSGAILLDRGETERIDHWRLETDSGTVEGECGPGTPDASASIGSDRWLRFAVDARLRASRETGFGRLTVVSAGRNPVARSFTFAVIDAATDGTRTSGD